jgi:lipoprotein-anchoring transpeptidase ErfK/SrfK
MKSTLASLVAATALAATSLAVDHHPLSHQQIEENTRLQIFLDNANFGPGKIDGRQGEFTKKALALYRQAKGLPEAASPNPRSALDTSGIDLSSVNPVFISYTITADDLANVGHLPSGPAAEAKVKRLPYATLAEDVAERFHCARTFLDELNPKKTQKLKMGDQVTVPNVKPFVVSAIKGLEPGSAAATVIANELGDDQTTPPVEPAKPGQANKAAASKISLEVSVKDEMLKVMDAGKIVAAFPVTVGSQQTASPIGKWTVKAIAKWPNFRYDLAMLNKGERSSHFHLLPPGPNNPVGVVWIALNKKGIGIHGTEDPDSIGRNASHGCIRLANWDIVRLAEMVGQGTPVTVE